MSREVTTALWEAIDSGAVDSEDILRMCLNYMGDADVEDMLDNNDLSNIYQEQSNGDDFLFAPRDDDDYESELDDY